MVDTATRSGSKSFVVLLVSLLAVAVASGIGGLAAGSSAEHYGQLQQPSWAPPSWVFGPAWTLLYVLMAVAAWLVWRGGPDAESRRALIVYALQLALNAAWTPLFFGLGWRGVALIELSVLWVAVAATVVLFWRRNVVAGCLLLPYLAWSTFALSLNFAVWQLNN